jgi:translocator assembly and maintenance protein 41
MFIGENKNKISNIVIPQIDLFIDLYSNLILNDTHLHWNKNRTLDTLVKQDVTAATIFTRLLALPKYVIYNIIESATFKTRQYQDTEEIIRKLCVSTQRTEKIEHAVRSIVRRSSITQTFKGLLTAGFIRSTRYALAKLQKMIR